MLPPTRGDDWCALVRDVIPISAAYEWVVRPNCGAVVLFSGTVRDHAAGRSGVETLEYEAYEEVVERSFSDIVAEARRRWPTIGRIVLLHRVGSLAVGESAVVAVASAPHRPEAFEAARFAIDTLKEAAPIWKRETWNSGSDWGTEGQSIAPVPMLRTTAP